MNWRNLAESEAGGPPAGDWLPEISECGIEGVVYVAGKDPDGEKILRYCMVTEDGVGCPNLVPIAMIKFKPGETIGKRRYQPNLDAVRCRLGI